MNDLIKREDAIEAIKGNSYALGDDYTEINGYGAIKDIRALPSAERPQGEWEVSCKDSVCSVCGKDEAEFICGTEDWYGYGLSNYCPHCGARMKGADDDIH